MTMVCTIQVEEDLQLALSYSFVHELYTLVCVLGGGGGVLNQP